VHLQLGIPILGMELMLGQVLQRGAVDALAMLNARAWGIGVAATLGSFLLASYYSAIMSWVWVFLLGSMNEVLPWSDGRAASFFYGDLLGQSAADVAAAEGTVVGGDGFGAPLAAAPLAGGLGPCKWWLVLGLGLNWLVCYACIFNGVESAGKAVWITMPLPYVLLFVLLVKGATLRGAGEGLTFYLWQWKGDAIADGSTWGDAVAQIFFGLGIACGIMPAYTSGCPEKEKIGRNAWIIGIANSATSIYAGFVSFAFLGHLAYTEGKSVADVAQGGWGLAFVVYPTAMGLFGPGAGQFFAVCFWLMLLALGVDSAFSLIESPICVVCDRFEWCAANRRITSAAACFSCFLVGLPMTTEGGYFVIDIMDAYVSRYTLIIAGMFECLFIGHVYDAERLQNEARALCGSGVGRALFAPIIKWVAPAILGAMLGYNVAQEAKGTYGGYPRWATAVFGWVLCVLGPLSFVVYGFFRPPRLKRPIEEAGIYAGN
jgi:SNF family Na+-dependent transporter